MNYKKYLLIFLSIFILIACKKLPENNTRSNYQKVKAMKENTFREKVAKYLAYAKILNDDKDLRATVLAERNRMEAKIEKTMDYRIIGGNDELLNIMIAENYRGYIEHNPFTKTKDNPDTILEITAKLVEYSPNKIEEKKEQNDFEEIYTDENGKEATNKVKYVKTHFFKSSYAKVEVKYKLISTLTGEVILQGNKIVDNEEYTYWDTYDVVSGTLKDKSQFYRNDREEELSNKEKFFRETAVKILKEINLELKKLPDYDIWKLYIS